MAKRYLTLEDLFSFCQTTNLEKFSAKESDGPIIVQSFGEISVEDTTMMGLTPATLQACHTQLNKNHSYISDEVMNNALASFSNRPILGYVHQLEDGTWDFYDHRMTLEEDGDESRVHFLETPIGVIPESCNAHLEYDSEKEKNYVVVNGYIYDDYGNRALDIIKAHDGKVDVSVELAVNAMSFNAKENYLNIEDFTFMGVTCLGKTPDGTTVQPGMEGANLKLDNFSAQQNSMFADNYQEKLIETLDKLNKTLSSFNIDSEKGGRDAMDNFENEVVVETEAEVEETVVENNEVEETEVVVEDSTSESEEETPAEEKFVKNFAIELSHEDIQYALYNLISQYDEQDNDWYFVRSVYDNYFYMQGWCNANIFKQGYSIDGENVALEGERQEMFEMILSESEKIAVEKLRADYSALEEKYNELAAFKANYDAEQLKAQKDAIFAKAEYKCLAENADFKKLIEDAEQYSVEELSTKADLIFATHMKSKMDFSAESETKPHSVSFNLNTKGSKKKQAYKGLFEND